MERESHFRGPVRGLASERVPLRFGLRSADTGTDNRSAFFLAVDVPIGDKLDGAYTPVTTWIDTAFDGHLVVPHELIETLKLESLVETEAILADGSKVTLETFVCFVDWFGNRIPLQIIANEGQFPLLGTGLLEQHVLHVDYAKKALSMD